MNSYKEIEEKF